MTVRHHTALLIAIVSLTATACAAAAGPPGASVGRDPSAAPSASLAVPTGSVAASQSPSPSPSPSAAALRVDGLTLTADPKDHIGACPIEITFLATFRTSGGSGTVSYRWVSSDGDTSPTKTIDVRDGSPGTVTSTWTVDRTTVPTHAGWSSVELVGPPAGTADAVKSARADFVFTCDADDDVEAIGFGIGGSDADCSIKTPGRSFATTDPIRVVANWWPSLADGTTVTIGLSRNGETIAGYPVTTHLNESTKCVHGAVSPGYLAPGHYRLDLQPDTARAIGGEFDVK
jgi:hypothetical protein